MRDRFAEISEEKKRAHFRKLNAFQDDLMLHPKLTSLFIEMTIQCNEHCLHCGSNCGDIVSQNPLTDQEILDCLIRLKASMEKAGEKLPFLNVTGGEPLLRKSLTKLMKQIHLLGFEWGMTTNGTLITQKVTDELMDAGIYSIGLSIDGLEETHNWFRNAKDGYRKTMEAFQILKEVGVPDIMITTVVHKRNLSELEALYEIMDKIQCKCWRVINVEPIGRALTNPDLMLEKEDYQYIIDFIANHQDHPDMKVIYSCNHYVGLYYERRVRPWYYQCRAGLSIASIQYQGDISACLDIERRPELTYGNIRKDDFYETWLNRFEIFRKPKTIDSKKCQGCEQENNCRGGGFHTWDFDSHEPQICMFEQLNG